jgi:hypothetical protein
LRNTSGPYIELSVLPVGVSWRASIDGTVPRIGLSAAELTELANGLYGLLAKFNGYVAAKVGWDPEAFLDPAELKSDWTDELADGTIQVWCSARHCTTNLASAATTSSSSRGTYGFRTAARDRARSQPTRRTTSLWVCCTNSYSRPTTTLY